MLFIPLLWGVQSKAASARKWALVRAHRGHVAAAIAGGLLGILPQLLYWKAVTGSFIYDVGSKWVFLNPWFRVLAGWEKGWFIYTPVTILFVAGLAFLKRYEFRYSVLVFCLLNIWIVIAWDDWQYGASYSTRALMQSYPVFAFALAALLTRLSVGWRRLVYVSGSLLIGLNLFQIWQYNAGIIHHRDMNGAYYRRVFLNPDPSALDMSLLDNPDWRRYGLDSVWPVYTSKVPMELHAAEGAPQTLLRLPLEAVRKPAVLRIQARVAVTEGRWDSKIGAMLREGDSVKTVAVRMGNPVGEKSGRYAFYMEIPESFGHPQLEVFIRPGWNLTGRLEELQVAYLSAY